MLRDDNRAGLPFGAAPMSRLDVACIIAVAVSEIVTVSLAVTCTMRESDPHFEQGCRSCIGRSEGSSRRCPHSPQVTDGKLIPLPSLC